MAYQKSPKNCPLCGEKADFKFIQDFKRLNDTFSLYECSKCHAQFWIPFKNPGEPFYETQFRITILDRIRRGRGLSWWHKECIKFLREMNIRKGRVLDIGCGTGEFLYSVQKLGLEAWGVDFDGNAVKIAKNFYNLKKIFKNSWKDFSQRKDLPKFNIITFFEVLEHLDDIPEFLRFVVRIASPDAYVIFSTPNRSRKALAADPSDDFPPTHLTRWDYDSLFKVFNIYGIKIVNEIYGGDIDHYIGTYFRFNIGRKIDILSQDLKQNRNKLLFFFSRLFQCFVSSNFYYNLAKAKNILFTPVAWCLSKFKKNTLKQKEKPYFLLIGKVRKQ